MAPGATRIKASDNMAGYYCGACHDRKRKFEGGTIFEACQKMPAGFAPRDTCYRCHSLGKNVMPVDDFALSPKVESMPEIVFSHAKHTVWNGCELCHPEIFVGVKRGMTKYTMVDIFEGKYCGVCHVNVAF